MTIKVKLPPLLAVNENIKGNTIRQIINPAYSIEADHASFTTPGIKGFALIPKDKENSERILLVGKKNETAVSFSKIIWINSSDAAADGVLDLSARHWTKHPQLNRVENYAENLKNVSESWSNGFSFVCEDEAKGVEGLREPQNGALHNILGHWAVTNDAATIVMPTGTGKTETMISILVSAPCEKILIIVPTDALRKQIAEKFLTFGVLKQFGVIGSTCLYPVVGVLNHRPQTIDEVDDFFSKCNVVVTTTHIAGQGDESIRQQMAEHCSNLFVDEAHHVAADTWKAIKKQFASKRILQFTATPFREDDKPVEGKIIFKYGLNRAQEKKFFTKINFKPVRMFARKERDEAIAGAAVEQLREDRKTYNHILMARVNTIPRAEKVFSIYKKYPELDMLEGIDLNESTVAQVS